MIFNAGGEISENDQGRFKLFPKDASSKKTVQTKYSTNLALPQTQHDTNSSSNKSAQTQNACLKLSLEDQHNSAALVPHSVNKPRIPLSKRK